MIKLVVVIATSILLILVYYSLRHCHAARAIAVGARLDSSVQPKASCSSWLCQFHEAFGCWPIKGRLLEFVVDVFEINPGVFL